ncbi:PAS domain S-box-containing protein/diguanylate cyclase (GGDEF) domain-containing protein [Noviherbaspirillum humi]|uniref:PAS domain S-box-containing protein/diguanylate cyclase (GGDEF) domain-containing protein n=2 Tax=Noviherbaspirillum humi TaxID=1688639 RepID=A0A239JMV6_9BURK|nr:PAS domain S-box-containing protein/diguanylate cyclase (GGDEF) domain-containing protein [Noviherbaspirillum humi]
MDKHLGQLLGAPPPQSPVQPAAGNHRLPVFPILEKMPAAAMAIGPDMRVVGINAACRAMLSTLCGRSVEPGDHVSSIPIRIETPTADHDTLERFCRHAFASTDAYIVGHCLGSKQLHGVLMKFTPVLDAFFQPLLLHLTLHRFPGDQGGDGVEHQSGRPVGEPPRDDIFPERENELDRALEAVPVGIAHVALDGRFLRVNSFLCNMLGYSKRELVALTYQDVTDPLDLEADEALVQELIDGKRCSYVMEKRYRQKSGNPIWAYLAVTLLRDESGAPKYFVSVVSDINHQKKALADVEESQARLKAVFDSLSEAVFVFNTKGQLLDANLAGLAMFGYQDIAEAAASVADLDKHFDVWNLDSKRVPMESWPIYRLLRGEQATNVELKVRQRSSGRTWIASFSGSLMVDGQGRPQFAVLTIRDITKRHYAQTSLKASEQRFRTALDHIPDMIVLYDRDYRIRYVNHAMVAVTQQPASALVGRQDDELRGIKWADLRRSALHAAAETASVQKTDIEFPSPNGTRHVAVTCVPLMSGRGNIEEIMCLYHDYTERKRAEEKARQAALHDPLTRLPNRALLFEYARHVLGIARRAHEKAAVLFIDLDRFKPINDLHGHEAGDEVLRQIAQRILTHAREEDMVFRLGGDEFLILLPRVDSAEDVGDMAMHLLAALNQPFYVGHLKLVLSASIGISLYPDHGGQIDTLINHADAAMYHAKQQGRNGFQFYESEMSDHIDQQAALEQELKIAIERNEFRLVYQPVVDMHTGRLTCVEALIRWPKNDTSADRFVPVAEMTGLIGPVGDWVLAEACRQHWRWKDAGLAEVPIAVNVSPVQFRRLDLAEQVQVTLQRHGLRPSALQLELTETAVMDDIGRAVEVLNRLRNMGIRISLDDFGTGYSSLNYLSSLPLDKLKIDQSFVRRIESDSAGRAVTDAVIVLGRTLGMTVVAEGIESGPVLEYLREHGCHEGQGYFICKPMSGEAMIDWIRGREQLA